MAKISDLPLVETPDGSETALILKDGVAQRAPLDRVVNAAAVQALAEIDTRRDQAAAQASLAGQYANAATDADIPGAPTGERGARYWARQSQAAAQSSPARANSNPASAWRVFSLAREIVGTLSKDGRIWNWSGHVAEWISATENRLRHMSASAGIGLLSNGQVRIGGLRIKVSGQAKRKLSITDQYCNVLLSLEIDSASNALLAGGLVSTLAADGTVTLKTIGGTALVTCAPGAAPVFNGAASTAATGYWTEEAYLTGRGARTLTATRTKAAVWGSSTIEHMHTALSAMFTGFGATSVQLGGDGGAQMQHLGAQMGAVPALLTASGDTLAASGRTDVTCSNMPVDSDMASFTGTWGGVPCRLYCDGTTFYLQRTTAGSAITVAAGTPFIPDVGPTFRDAIFILNPGKNNMPEADTADAIIAFGNTLFAWQSSYLKQGVMMGHFVNPDGANAAKIRAVNAAWKARYGAQFFDLSAYLCSAQVWTDTGLAPTSADLTAQANGYLAPSLALDSQHMTPTAETAVIAQLSKLLTTLQFYA